MPLVPLYAEPGICKVNSPYSSGKAGAYVKDRVASGRYIDGNFTRFVAGFPEKIRGWLLANATQMVDVPRAMTDFRDNNSNARLGIGTDSHLYYFDGMNIVDITPERTISAGTLGANPFTTSTGSAVVAVADASQQLQNNDWVMFSGATPFNNVTINGWYIVSGRTGTGYNITASTVASANGTGGGTLVIYSYPRVTLGADPFSTTNLSPVVTVTHISHGAVTGNYVDISGATAVAGLTLNGDFQVTVLTVDTYTITASSPANATTTGGGSAVSVTYDIPINLIATGTPLPYGVGAYGIGSYGYGIGTTPSQFSGWTLAAYGSDLLAAPIGGTIYIYDPSQGGVAHPVLNAPASVLAIFVTPERFLFALGINGNSMQLAWPDQSDITNWTTTPSNTANSGRSFQGGTYFVAGEPVQNGVSLFWSNRCTFEASYTGNNEIYSTPLLSDQSGLIGPQAKTTLGGIAYWMSDHDFWAWNGAVTPLPSDDIRDYVFTNINTSYQSRSVAGTNRAKKEVWFFYPSASSTDIDSYVVYHIDQGVWSIGKLNRTAWRDSDLFTQPFGCDPSGFLYQHEVGSDAAGLPIDAYITFAPMDVSNGDKNVDMFGFIPDMQRQNGALTLTINVQDYPETAARSYGPFVLNYGVNPLIDMRADGKMVGFTLESNVLNGDFRLGLSRANVQPSGARL